MATEATAVRLSPFVHVSQPRDWPARFGVREGVEVLCWSRRAGEEARSRLISREVTRDHIGEISPVVGVSCLEQPTNVTWCYGRE